MHLSNHISKLLFDHDCVTIPGFGSFLGNYKSAQYDFKKQKFYPPTKKVSFNSQIKDNDGLLAREISKDLNLSYEEAVKKIHYAVLSWTKKIKSETLVLKNIGELYLNGEDKIIFIPSNEFNHLKESFGLSPIFISQIETVKSFPKTAAKPLKIKKNNYFIQAAIWTFLIVGLSSLYMNEKNNILKRELAYEQEYRKQTKQKVQKAIFDLGSLPSLTVNVKMKQKRYFIIAGAFRISQNAENLVLNLKQKGYNAAILSLNEKGLNPVAFTSFISRNDAVSELRLIQKKENKEAWIFEAN